MKKNIKKLTLGLSVLAALTLLAGCDDIEAKLPDSEYNAPLLNTGDLTITNNKLGEIYDALVSSGISNNDRILENLLLKIAESTFGTFEEIKAAQNNLEAFANAHIDGYHTLDENGNKIVNKEQVKTVYEHLLEQINREFVSYVSNATYSEGHRFYEERFYNAQKTALYKLGEVDEDDFKGKDAEGKDVGVQVLPSPAYNEKTGFGTSYLVNYFQADYLDVYKDYIERSILPNLMRKLLTQRYILDNNYVALGRSAARKVQYITVDDSTKYPGKLEALITSYAKLVLAGKSVNGISLTTAEKNAIANKYGTSFNDLNFLNELVGGFFNIYENPAFIRAAAKVYQAAGYTKIDAISDEFYTITAGGPGVELSEEYVGAYETLFKETTYGDYLTQYAKIDVTNRFTNDGAAYNEYTGNGAHAPNVGMKQKVIALISADTTTEGWFQEANVGNLMSDYSSRLFKNTVANDVEELGGEVDKELAYGWQVNGSYYLTRTSYPGSIDPVPAPGVEYNPSPYLLNNGNSWTIVRVDEAVKNSLMRSDTYEAKAEVEKYMSYALSSNTAYTDNAQQYYVEQAALAFHDQAVYDYFKEAFPDIFDK